MIGPEIIKLNTVLIRATVEREEAHALQTHGLTPFREMAQICSKNIER